MGAWCLLSLRSLMLLSLLCLATFAANAKNLLEVYQLALNNDPALRAAAARRLAVLETRPQSRALLLPVFSASANYSDNRNEILGSDSPVFQPQTVYFITRGYSLSLTQPIYNREYFVQQKQADALVKGDNADYAAAQQDLIIRVAEAYFNILGAMDNLAFVQADKKAIQRQLEQAKQRFEVGLIAITDVHESQAAYDDAVAREIEAENLLSNTREDLRVITGRRHEHLSILAGQVPLIKPEPTSIDRWSATARQQNFSVIAGEYNVRSAREEVERRRSGHYPTLDLTGSHRYLKQDDSAFGGGSETKDSAVGLVFNLPIFQGGAVSSRVREALHLLDQARDELEQRRRDILRQTRNSYLNVLAGIETVKARKQAVISAQSALDATEAGLEVGTRTTVDVLDVRQNLLKSERDLARSRYNYILDTLRLKQAAGRLTPDDMKPINGWLQ